jgi:metal-responsive CopG/Arc/MetJ family transcriptional regulator
MAPPKKDNIPLTLRISERLLDKIDDLRRQEKDIPTRPEMIRRLLEESLKD